MSKITSCSLAVVLAITAIAASAQDAGGQQRFGNPEGRSGQQRPQNSELNPEVNPDLIPDGDAFGTDQSTARQQRRTSITNAPDRTELGTQRATSRLPGQTSRSGVPNVVRAEKKAGEFQKFVFDSTGMRLPIFGSQFFAGATSTFAPILNSPVPSDYLLGPGDELLIRGWGTIDIDYHATIDRTGTVTIPTIGSVVLAGVKAGEAEAVIRGAIGKLYKGVTVSVNFGQLRAITVYVVGQANRPGTYTVSSLSTLVTAVFASGGPNASGSMRRVQVKRGGKVAAEFDLYAFIAKGDKSADIKLQDGDTIYIPPAGGFVALVGKVNTSAVYELKGNGDTVGALLDFAGGMPVVADPRRALLERVDPSRAQPRSVEQFALNAEGLGRPLKNGDVLNITSITPDFSNAVMLRGNVDQPMRVPFKSGMRISDLIPSREVLITRASTKRQNDFDPVSETNKNLRAEMEAEKDKDKDKDAATEKAKDQDKDKDNIATYIGTSLDEINWDYALVERVNRTDLTVSLIPFNLGNVFTDPSGTDNIRLQPGDTVTVFSQQDVAVPIDKRRVFVRAEGEVKVPGVYQMRAGETLQTLLAKAGGPTANAYLFGAAFYRETVRKEQQISLEKAATRLEAQLRAQQGKSLANLSGLSSADAAALQGQRAAEMELAAQTIARFRQLKPTGRIAFGLDTNDRSTTRLPDLKLENGDRFVLPSQPAFVQVFGAVNVEASPLWKPHAKVKDYLRMAGPSTDADLANVFVMRVDGTVVTGDTNRWFFGNVDSLEVMPGDSIVIPEKIDKETAWTKFTRGTREWAQIFANFGLGAAAIKTLRN